MLRSWLLPLLLIGGNSSLERRGNPPELAHRRRKAGSIRLAERKALDGLEKAFESSTLEWHHSAHRDFDKKMRVRLLLFPFFFLFESGSPVWWCQERATSPRSLSTWLDELGIQTLAVRKGSRVLQEDRVELTPVCQSKSEDWVSESVKSPSIPSRKVRSMRSLSRSGVVWSFLGGQYRAKSDSWGRWTRWKVQVSAVEIERLMDGSFHCLWTETLRHSSVA